MDLYKQGEESGLRSILESFRTEVPLSTRKEYPNLRFEVEGSLPDQIMEHLPILGSKNTTSGFYALNSGGRGILLSDGKTHLRFKGCDLDGSITSLVGSSKKNMIADTMNSARIAKTLNFDTSILRFGGVYRIPYYNSEKPFSFLTREAVENEKYATQAINESFKSKGFNSPYTFQASITYPNIIWRGEPCATIVFSLPTLESDLRFDEFFMLAKNHLKYSSIEQAKEIKEDLGNFLKKITSWHGFLTNVMAENHLSPDITSHQYQNHVLSHIKGSDLGVSRVDHTSTVCDKEKAVLYKGAMEKDVYFFTGLQTVLIHAIDLHKQGYKFDTERYMSYFDRAYKWYEPLNLSDIPGMTPYFTETDKAFKQGLKKDPIPIPEKELIKMINLLSEIKIDEERENAIKELFWMDKDLFLSLLKSSPHLKSSAGLLKNLQRVQGLSL